jgi:MoaA/NifB/PqqE/SkfB family radical SAM enzyme
MDVELVRMAIANRRKLGVLPDSFKGPVFVLWEITYACPLRCIHCYNHSGDTPGRHMPTESLLKIADQLGELQVHSVCLTGGEPAVHKGYLDVARRLKEHGVSVGTPLSGWMLNEELADEMAGLFDTLQVSVDGATAETHDKIRGVPGSFDRAIQACHMLDDAIERWLDRRVPPTLCGAFVANKLNFHEIEPFIDRMATSFKNLNEIRVQSIVPVGRAHELGIHLEKEQTDEMEALCSRKNMQYYPRVHVDPGDPTFHLMKPRVGHAWDLACIDPQGNVRFSPWLSGEVGQIGKDGTLQEIWEGELIDLHKSPRFLQHINKINHVNDMHDAEIALQQEFRRFGAGPRP